MKKIVIALGAAAFIAIGLIAQPAKTSPAPAAKRDTIPGRHVFSHLNITTSNDGDRLMVKGSATDEKGNAYSFREVDGKMVEFSVNGKEIAKEDYHKYVDIFDSLEDIMDSPPVPPVQPIPPVPPLAAIPPAPPVPEIGSVPTPMPAPAVEAIPPVAPIPPVPPAPPASGYYVRHIIRDLRRDHLITEDDPLKFKLDNDGFTVNGVKQPAEVFKRYKEKYLDRPSDHFIYDRRGGSTHTEISTGKEEPEEI